MYLLVKMLDGILPVSGVLLFGKNAMGIRTGNLSCGKPDFNKAAAKPMTHNNPLTLSNGYEEVAERFMLSRNPHIGVSTVREWSQRLPPGASILDLGCGHGIPISQTLLQEGFIVYGVDASVKMITAFRANFPQAVAECAGVEESDFFGRTFDGLVAWGLLFLLPPEEQVELIHKAGKALRYGGLFLFTAPREAVTWNDAQTGRKSRSLRYAAY